MQRKSVFRGGVGMKSRTTQAKELRRQGMSYKAISDQLGASYGAVYGWINDLHREHTPNPLVDVECVDCGRVIQRRAAVADDEHRCHPCASRATHARGWMTRCQECGDEFWVAPSDKDRKYCSRVCWRKNARLTDEQYAANAERMRRKRKGKGNPGFKHGRAVGRNVREMTVARKGETHCRLCGVSEPLHLHHAVPRSLAPAGRGDLRNGIVLCAKCHQGWHDRRLTIPRELFTAEEWAFIETLTGEHWLDERYPKSEREAASGIGWPD